MCGVIASGTASALDCFFFNDTATTEIYTLSLHDALPIFPRDRGGSRDDALPTDHQHARRASRRSGEVPPAPRHRRRRQHRSEEHTSELQSLAYLVCRLLLEKKND